MIVDVQSKTLSEAEMAVIKRNIQFFCNIPRGSLPQMRNYGIDFSAVGEGYDIAKRKLTVDIISGVRDTFGIHISEIDITADENGDYKVNIKI